MRLLINHAALTTCLLLFALPGISGTGQAQNWPSFRGADASGLAPGRPPVTWNVSSSDHVAWKTPIPGLSHSSPIVWAGRVYVTTAIAAEGTPQLTIGQAGIDPAQDVVRHTWRLYSLDARTGAIL